MVEDIEQIYKRTEQYGRIQFVEEIDKLQCEKQQLIKFLEDKIKRIENDASKYKYGSIKRFKFYKNAGIDIYQEVLDFVTKGGKDE